MAKNLFNFRAPFKEWLTEIKERLDLVWVFLVFFLQIDQFIFFCFNVSCIPTENKTGVPCLFLFISTNEYFLSPMHVKNWMNYTYVVVLLPSLYIIDIFFKLVIRGLILGQAENHYFKNSPREN